MVTAWLKVVDVGDGDGKACPHGNAQRTSRLVDHSLVMAVDV